MIGGQTNGSAERDARARFLESVESARSRFAENVRLEVGARPASDTYRENDTAHRVVIEGRADDPYAFEMIPASGIVLTPLVAYAALTDRLPWAALVVPLGLAFFGVIRATARRPFRLELEGDTLRLTRAWPWKPRELVLEGSFAIDLVRPHQGLPEIFVRTREQPRAMLLRGIHPRGLESSIVEVIDAHRQWRLTLRRAHDPHLREIP